MYAIHRRGNEISKPNLIVVVFIINISLLLASKTHTPHTRTCVIVGVRVLQRWWHWVARGKVMCVHTHTTTTAEQKETYPTTTKKNKIINGGHRGTERSMTAENVYFATGRVYLGIILLLYRNAFRVFVTLTCAHTILYTYIITYYTLWCVYNNPAVDVRRPQASITDA